MSSQNVCGNNVETFNLEHASDCCLFITSIRSLKEAPGRLLIGRAFVLNTLLLAVSTNMFYVFTVTT